MKHAFGTRVLAGLIVIASIAVAADAFAQNAIPELTAQVNDFAGVIDAASANQLDALVRKLQGATGDVMVIATIKTFQPEGDIKSYAVKMFENHGKGIGTRATGTDKSDNGVLILLDKF